MTAPLRIWQAVRQAKAIMRSYQPDVVLGMGGYVSGPGGLAAWQCGIPVVLHEQNGIAGLTNRWLARIAAKVMQAFPGAFPTPRWWATRCARRVGAATAGGAVARREGPIRVLVIGGSQGARVLNQTVPEVAARLGDRITLWHQVGKGALETVLRDYERVGQTQHKVTEFIDDMAAAYAWADVVVCRSGALTVSEIAAAGLPAIFVPFMHKDRQQYWNARPLEEAGAAKIIEQPQFNADVVAELLASWDRKTLLAMAEKARAVAFRTPPSAWRRSWCGSPSNECRGSVRRT